MVRLSKRAYVFQAHHPREVPQSTVSPEDRLKVVCNIYSDADRDNYQTPYRDRRANLFFMHATTYSKEVWEPMIEMALAEFGDKLGLVIAMDAVNHCDSYALNRGKLGSHHTWSDGGRDIIAVLRQLNVTPESTIVVGHSMGGSFALHAALFESALVDSAVVIDPVVGTGTTDPQLNAQGFAHLMGRVAKVTKDKFASRQDLDKYLQNPRSHLRTFDPAVYKLFIDHNFVETPDGAWLAKTPYEQQLGSYMGAQYVSRSAVSQFCGIQQEILVVKGEIATWNPPGMMDSLKETLNNSSDVEVPQGDHLMVMQKPKETYQHISSFLGRRIERILAHLDKRAELVRGVTDDDRRPEIARKGIDADIKAMSGGEPRTYSRL